jgi:hypothetical protein
MSVLSPHLVEVPAGQLRATLIVDASHTWVATPCSGLSGADAAAHLRWHPSRIDRVREDVRPEASDGESQHDNEQL